MTGILLIAGALIWFSRLPAPGGSYAADVLGPSLLGAVGLGFAFVPVTIANSRTQNVLHSGVHSATVALAKGFDTAFFVAAGFATAGAILTAILISSRDSREYAEAARAERRRCQSGRHRGSARTLQAIVGSRSVARARRVARALLACLDSCRRVISFRYRFIAS